MVAVPDWEMRRRAAAKPVTATPPVALPTLLPLLVWSGLFVMMALPYPQLQWSLPLLVEIRSWKVVHRQRRLNLEPLPTRCSSGELDADVDSSTVTTLGSVSSSCPPALGLSSRVPGSQDKEAMSSTAVPSPAALSPFSPCSSTAFRWGDVDGDQFSADIAKVYEQQVQRRKNIFSPPSGHAGMDYVREHNRLLCAYSNKTPRHVAKGGSEGADEPPFFSDQKKSMAAACSGAIAPVPP